MDVTAELAQELLEAADQYMLDNLKRLCEIKIAEELQPDNVSVVSASEAGGAHPGTVYLTQHWH